MSINITQAYQEITLLEDRAEMHIRFGGLWNPAFTREKMDEMSKAALPLIKAGRPIYSLTDFTDALPQDQESASIIGKHLQDSVHFGLKRVAVLNASNLMKMQYKRLSKGIDVAFFTSKAEALRWLRDR